jgi:hypothetical protein
MGSLARRESAHGAKAGGCARGSRFGRIVTIRRIELKGKVAIVVLALAAALALVACGTAGTPAISPWSMIVTGEGVQKEFALSDLEALPTHEIEYNSKETGAKNKYTCVLMRDVLESTGVNLSTVQSVEVEADDMFLAQFDRSLAVDGEVFLAIRMDGRSLPSDMGAVRVIAPGQGTKMQVRFVRRITVR